MTNSVCRFRKIVTGIFHVSAGFLVLAATGCGAPARDMAPARPGPRAPETDALGMYVGEWEGAGEARFPGDPTVYKAASIDRYAWACDRTFLVNDLEVSRGENRGMVGRGGWTWDANARKYRNWWFDSDGSTATGTATFDAPTRTWHVFMDSHNTLTGRKTYGSGVSRFIDANTIEWTWNEWDNSLRLGTPLMEMKGTLSRRG